MLVITRREGEEVVIGDPSAPLGVVRIAAIKGDRVRIAFEFPREIDVHRREVAKQIVDGDLEYLQQIVPPELIEAADLVTEMELVKHPFRSGIKAQIGVEF